MQDKKIFAAEVGGKTLKAQIIVLALLSIIGGIFIIQQKFANDSQVDLLQQEVIRLKNLSCQVELQKQKENKGNDTIGSMESVMETIKLFGEKMRAVPKIAPDEIIRQKIQQNYIGLLSDKLYSDWISDPQKAPGRVTSSPWPEGISVISVDYDAGLGEVPKKYKAEGYILEMTSTGVFSDSAKIVLTVVEENGKWVIDSVEFVK